MCELLRLGNTQLLHAGFRYYLAHGVVHVLFGEEHMQPLER